MGRLGEVLACFGRVWEALAVSVRVSKALEALGVSGRYGRLWEAFRKL